MGRLVYASDEERREAKARQHRERRERLREKNGAMDRAQWIAFVREQAIKSKSKAPEVFVITPSQERIEELNRIVGERESVEEFLARGGKVERLKGVESRPLGRGIPVRMHMSVGSRAE